MARPLKTGLDYFPLDVDFFSDEKIQVIAAKYDELGVFVIIKLLSRIYRNGYFLKWDNETVSTFADNAGKNISIDLVNNVIQEALKQNLFSTKKFAHQKILTSNGIQKRYVKFCNLTKRKPDLNFRYVVSSELFRNNSVQKKGKESKGKEMKLKESDPSKIQENNYHDSEEIRAAAKRLHRQFNR
jgi:hypothetical protein